MHNGSNRCAHHWQESSRCVSAQLGYLPLKTPADSPKMSNDAEKSALQLCERLECRLAMVRIMSAGMSRAD